MTNRRCPFCGTEPFEQTSLEVESVKFCIKCPGCSTSIATSIKIDNLDSFDEFNNMVYFAIKFTREKWNRRFDDNGNEV